MGTSSNRKPMDAYFLCSTPRTGSTLLCSFLKSSGVAGNPESYFRKEDRGRWSEKWGISASTHPSCPFSAFLNAAIAAGRSENGVFAARIMWGTMEELIADLARLYPDTRGNDLDLLHRAFGASRLVYLKRKDTLAQAVSLLRAVQTDIWHVTDSIGTSNDVEPPRYDFQIIREYKEQAEDHNAAWLAWFRMNGIDPLPIVYEELDRDPVAETCKILDYLELELPHGVKLSAKNKRLSDQINTAWIERFVSEAEL